MRPPPWQRAAHGEGRLASCVSLRVGRTTRGRDFHPAFQPAVGPTYDARMNDTASIEIETGPNPQASVIILHGLGASGDDFVPVCEQMDLRTVGDVRYVLPH